MDAKKIVGIIFSIIIIGAFGFLITWSVINFNKLEEALSGTQIYDATDLDNAYKDGYNTALTNKEEYDELINSYRDTITSLNDNISQLNSQIANLQNTNRDSQNQINRLTEQKESLELDILTLTENQSKNETTISILNGEITNLNTLIANLNNTISSNEITINGLNTQIISLNTQIASLQQTITNNDKTISDLRKNINELNAEIEELSKDAYGNQAEIQMLNSQISSLNEQITSLTNLNNDYVQSINNLRAEVSSLKAEKDNLILENTNYYNTISSLNNQILNLQNVNTQLENTNTLHLTTIASLNSQIASLNQQISDIQHESQNNNSTITSLNEKIRELEESVQYYENYISSLENGDQVVATFEYDGSVYNIQIVNKGATVAVSTPVNTEYLIFNGWKVGDEFIDLSTYTITQNTKIVADLTYKYSVKFKVDSSIYNSQIVVKGNYAELPTSPTKSGYSFDGWAVDNVNIVDVSTTAITEHTTFTAIFTKLHTVNFIYEDTTKSTQTIRNGSTASIVNIANTTYKIFNGWKVNGSIVEVSTYKITADTTFVADITYRYDVVYKVDNTTYSAQIVTANNYPNLPNNPVKTGYEFDGWSINGVDIINTSALQITSNTTYVAVFTKVYNVSFVYENSTISTQTVRENKTPSIINVDNTPYKLFNGWKVNGEFVDINTYNITQNTTFVADITYKYDVTFKVDNSEYNKQIIEKGKCVTLPKNPTKAGYEFDGWTVNGVDVIANVASIQVTGNITYIARFTQVHSVSFVYDNKTISTQTIRNAGYAQIPSLENSDYIIFNGWKVNNSYVDVTTYSIITPTTFIADITYRYDVIYMSNGTQFASEIVTSGNYATVTDEPFKDNYYFEGWTLDGENVIDLSSYPISQKTILFAKFTQQLAGLYSADNELLVTWDEIIENNYLQVSDTGVVSNGSNIATFRTLEGKLVISNEVTAIGSGGSSSGFLYNCTNLSSVTIPESVTSIGGYAFYYCTHLTEINFNAIECADFTVKDYIFGKVGTLTDGVTLNIGNKVKKIPLGFMCPYYERTNYNVNLKVVNIGESVESIGRYAFYQCPILTDIYYNAVNCSDLKDMNYTFQMAGQEGEGIKLVIGDSVKRIPAYLFDYENSSNYGAKIISISFGRNVEEVGNYAFQVYSGPSVKDFYFYDLEKWLKIDFNGLSGCNPLASVNNVYLNGVLLTELVIPETVTEIGVASFYWCKTIQSVVMHDNVTKVGRYAFNGCSALTNMRISNSLSFVGDSAFTYCNNLNYTTYGNCYYLGNESNPYVYLVDAINEEITTCEINENCRFIGSSSLARCPITSIYIPYSVIAVGDSAFYGCFELKTVIFAENSQVTTIAGAFYWCKSLTSIIIPANCTELGYQTFYDCESLKTIYIPKAVIDGGTRPFYNCADLVIYCEVTEDECQLADGWNNNSSKTQATVKYGYTLEQYLAEVGG